MRVITTFFSMECPRLVPGPSVESAPGEVKRDAGKGAMHVRREWLGLHEGENRVALVGRPVPRRRPKEEKVEAQVLFFTLLMD